VLEDLTAGARQANSPVLEYQAARAELEPGAGVLLDQQDRPPLLVHQPDHPEDGLARGRVEPDRRLVEHDQRRIEHQAARELDEPLLAARQAAGLVVGAFAHEREQLLDVAEAAAHELRVAHRVRPHLDVLAHGHLAEQAVRLRDEHDAAGQHLARREADERLAAERDRSLPGTQDAADRRQQGGLAGAVRTDDAHDLVL
jgi:hypothetical protein